jgi:hypothetical protein
LRLILLEGQADYLRVFIASKVFGEIAELAEGPPLTSKSFCQPPCSDCVCRNKADCQSIATLAVHCAPVETGHCGSMCNDSDTVVTTLCQQI